MRVFRVKDIQPRKPTISSSVLIRYRFSLSTVVNRALLCFHGGLLEITLTTLVSFDFFLYIPNLFFMMFALVWKSLDSLLEIPNLYFRMFVLVWKSLDSVLEIGKLLEII